MSGPQYRLPAHVLTGGRIDRDAPLAFSFNGETFTGYAGDTLASALLAYGAFPLARGFKYHRPRGIWSAGAEEPNALVQLETGGHTQPNLRATQIELYGGLTAASVNAWPSVDFDLMRVNDWLSPIFPAGFYYKTFMGGGFGGGRWWKLFEPFIRRAAGFGKAPTAPDPDRYERMNAHCDVLVVGGGPAGLSAALVAANRGCRVILADEQVEPGGDLLAGDSSIDDAPAMDWVAAAMQRLGAAPDVTVLGRTAVAGLYDDNFATAVENVGEHFGPSAPAHLPRLRLWRIRARQVVLATGAHERPYAFANNDTPGAMLGNAIRHYAGRYAVVPGRQALLGTNNDSAYRTARMLAEAGVAVTLADARETPPAGLAKAADCAGVTVEAGCAISVVLGDRRVRGAKIGRVLPDGETSGAPRLVEADLVGVSGGWNPALHLASHRGAKPVWREAQACFVPDDLTALGMRAAGAVTGAETLADCLEQGYAAGRDAARAAGRTKRTRKPALKTDDSKAIAPIQPLWAVTSRRPGGRKGKSFVDLQNDVTVKDVALAARENYRSVEHLKRYTTLGMGTDQGKTANVTGLALMGMETGRTLEAVGITTFRPPYTPVPFGALAGRDRGALFDPVRETPMFDWHAANGAVFEDVGQWKRPYAYRRDGETLEAAIDREVRAVRDGVGAMDASTLGKIDLKGPDVATLLNRVYTNDWSKLKVGRARYGLMCHEDGMIFDDGVTARLGDENYVMTTTTGNAATVLAWLEMWLQTEWPELRVFATSVTEAYATATVAGPEARALVSGLDSDIDWSDEAFPHMAVATGTIMGVPARVFRVSFSGEASWEINVPAHRGLALWQALIDGGATPYGTEAMHVLRAEKGFIIVGQETDGTVTPSDVGMGWAVSKRKDFIGKRSYSRPDTARPDRKHLVGLLPLDRKVVLPEGGQIVADPDQKPPMTMLGHVTSSYRSPSLNGGFALALLKNGRNRMGDTIHILKLEGDADPARVVEPVFYDKEGGRLRG